MVGLIALVGADPRKRHVAHDVGEHGTLDLGDVDGRAGRAGHGRDGADMIEVRVRQQDRLDRQAEIVDGREDPLGLVAGVEDHGPVRPIATRDEAVLRDGADGEHPNVHHAECI